MLEIVDKGTGRKFDWPDDFQQLVVDLFECRSDRLELLPVDGFISDHFDEIHENMDYWGIEDFDRVRLFLAAIKDGIELPPLVADTRGGLLKDGYHRAAAMLLAGIDTCSFLYLDWSR